MSRLTRPVLWAALVAIVLLTCFSIYGAFLGADRAREFFNSLPLAVYWFAFAVLLVVGVVLFRRLRRVPALLLMHTGCVLILAGGMWGSRAGNALQRQLLGIDKICEGRMPILEGTSENRVIVADSNDVPLLPFSVRLRDFRLEYYGVGTLMIRDQAGHMWRTTAEPGKVVELGSGLGTVTVERVFQNFKMDIGGDEPVAFDAPGGSNPAVQVQVAKPDGTVASRYVFESFPGYERPQDRLTMSYRRTVRDFISELEIVRDGVVVASKNIEVNHPLHYGGYHFYQHEYGENQMGEYTVLMVASDSGLNAVYAGYIMLAAAVCWHFWGRRVLARVRIVPSDAPAKARG
jgi:hypothetical protein